MSNTFMNDQAAGLRRIMAEPKPRIVSILSACSEFGQPQLLTNIAASIRCHGSDVLIVHAAHESDEAIETYEIQGLPPLSDVANQRVELPLAIRGNSHGFYVSRLMRGHHIMNPLENRASTQLNRMFTEMASQYEIVLVDATLNHNHTLPLKTLNDSDILIQLNTDPDAIKQAYLLIKKICGQLGRRSFGIIVDQANEAQAEAVYRNIAQVARRFMQVELEFFGAIPPDEHLRRAHRLGRAVVDAFPMASASAAFKLLAQRLDDKHDYAADYRQAAYI